MTEKIDIENRSDHGVAPMGIAANASLPPKADTCRTLVGLLPLDSNAMRMDICH